MKQTKPSKPAPRKLASQPPKTTSRAAQSVSSSWAPAASAVAPLILDALTKPHAKKDKKKKKKNSFASYLKGAAKVAAQIAPTVLPLLLAGHAPSNLSAKAAGVQGVPDLGSAGMVGVASAASVAQYATGTGIPSYKSNGNNVISVTWPGCEELSSINKPPSGNVWAAGQVMAKLSLNPASPDWSGTQLQVQARLWTRYKLKRISIMFQPAVATTTAGQMIGFCSSDPDQPFSFTGDTALKAALVHQFSDIFNTWSVGVVGMAVDSTTGDFYTQGDGSDPRLTSPGDFYLICSADIDMTLIDTLGTIVVAYEYDFSVKSDLDTSYAPGAGSTSVWGANLATANAGLWSWVGNGTSGTPPTRTGTLATLTPWGQFSNGDYGWTLPAGTYLITFFQSTTGTGTNASSELYVRTDQPFDNKTRYVKTIDGTIVSGVGLVTYTSATGGSVFATVRHGSGNQYIAGHFVISASVQYRMILGYRNTTQTGAWLTGQGIVSLSNIYDDMFAPPVVPPMLAMKNEVDGLRESNAELARKVDAMAALLTSAHSPPDVAAVTERLFALYDAHAPKFTSTSGP